MKKLLFLFVMAGALAACNNDAKSSSDVKDSVLDKLDSSTDAKIDSLKDNKDSLANRIDKSFDKTDSANKALADSTKKH
jgi:hypothetical protein